jgi:hypothetical protein
LSPTLRATPSADRWLIDASSRSARTADLTVSSSGRPLTASSTVASDLAPANYYMKYDMSTAYEWDGTVWTGNFKNC